MELTEPQKSALQHLGLLVKAYEKNPTLEEGRSLLIWLWLTSQANPELFND